VTFIENPALIAQLPFQIILGKCRFVPVIVVPDSLSVLERN